MTTPFEENIPKPGEPLKPEVHPQNQALIDDEVARRLELSRSKLTKRQHKRLATEYRKLHRQLNRAGYNRLVSERERLLEDYRSLAAAYKRQPTAALKKKLLSVQRAGREVTTRLEKLAPTAAKFERIGSRLRTHDEVLRIEREERENRRAFYAEAAAWEEQIISVFRQLPALHNITRDEKGKEYCEIPKIDHIFLKADKLYFRVQTSRQSWLQRLTGKWESALPYGVKIKDLMSEDTLLNMSAACGRVVTCETSPRSQNLFYVISRLDSADGIPRVVRLEQIADYYPTERHGATPWGAGIGEDRKVIHLDFEQYAHMLIAGASGGGKSNMINSILAQLVTMNTPDELRLYMIDNKGGIELSHWNFIPHLLTPPIISVDGVVPALQFVTGIIQQRLAIFREAGMRDLKSYNQKSKTKVARLVVVVDEMATLIGIDETKEIIRLLTIITSQGRAVGVNMIISTQHPSVEIIPAAIKTNLTLRVAFRMPNHTASQVVIDSISAAHIPDIPGRAVFRRGGFEQTLQTPLITDDGIKKAVTIAQDYPPAAWQIEESSTPEEQFTPIFGELEYLRAAIDMGGALSPRHIYDQVAKQYLTQREAIELGQKVIERLKQHGRVEVDGTWYITTTKGRGTYLQPELDSLLNTSEQDTPQESEQISNELPETTYTAAAAD